MTKILIIDIETTNFSPKKDKIVEVGIVALDLMNGNTEIVFDEIIHEPGIKQIDVEKRWVFENSDIGDQFFDHDCRNLEMNKSSEISAFDDIQKILNSYPLGATAFNKAFDFGFMKHRGFIFPKELRCPMILATNICKLPAKRGGYKWPKVEEAYKYFFPGKSYVEKHRGADDAIHEAEIVYKIYKLGLF